MLAVRVIERAFISCTGYTIMSKRVCPWWLGYLLVNPLRKLLYKPENILKPYIHEGMTVLEVGSGMGFFTLPMARLVGRIGPCCVC